MSFQTTSVKNEKKHELMFVFFQKSFNKFISFHIEPCVPVSGTWEKTMCGRKCCKVTEIVGTANHACYSYKCLILNLILNVMIWSLYL
jgi:hypothetical protein